MPARALLVTILGACLAGCATPALRAGEAPLRPAALEEPGLRRWQGQRDTWIILPSRGHEALPGAPDAASLEGGLLSVARFRMGDAAQGLAVLVGYPPFDRSLLHLYDADGGLIYQQVLPWSCSSLEVDSHDTAADVLLLGCGGRLVGNGPFLAVYRRSLEIREAREGPDSAALLPELRAIAWALVHLDRGSEALPYAERAVAIAEAGDSAHELAESLNVLGMVETGLDRHGEAVEHLGRALALVDREAPDGKRIESDIHYNLGRIQYDQGELDRAERHFLAALAVTRFPADTAKAAYNLTRVYLDQGRLREAEEMVLLAIEQDTLAYAPDHPEVERDLTLHARILRRAGRESEAEALEARLGRPETTLEGPASIPE